MSILKCLTAFITVIVLTTACQNRDQTAANPPVNAAGNSSTTAVATPPTEANSQSDKWLGQWNGPEGTFLLLSKNGERYVVKIQSLDGPQTYEGVSVGNRIQFERDGKTESIRAGTGAETGMKWLLDEKNCLIIKTGEGFCRK